DELPVWIQHKTDPNITQKSNRVYSNMVELVDCEKVYIRDVTLQNTTEWTLHMFDCTDVLVDGLKIDNNLYGPNADGFDLSGCQNVRITNCNISTCDDGICIKTFPASRESKNITVTNSVIRTSCAALKLGEVYKPISDITFSNCTIYESSRAFAIYTRHGGDVSNINVSNIVANTNAPLVLNRPFQLGAWDMKDRKTGETIIKGGDISNVTITNFLATTEGRAMVTADDGAKVKNLTLRNISFNYPYIENPETYGAKATSGQFQGMNEEGKTAKAAMILSGVEDVLIDNFSLNFPNPYDSVPKEWRHPVRIENGSNSRHTPVYGLAKQTEMQALWIRDSENVFINSPLANSSSSDLLVLDIENSSYKVMDYK
ncbi:MAG: right-handed parallel beta-helix repeat-containing protein, partial [Ekhidna sp.]|nr:right-handed parallel beta-helix repeat-containing protein [Ekhidna sp.]